MFRRCGSTGLVRAEIILRARVNGDALKPHFAPPMEDAARTEDPPAAIKRFAADAFQDDGRRVHPPQLSGLLVHEAFDAGADAKDLAAERHEFGIERKTPVGHSGVQRRKDFLMGSDPYQIARPKAEIASGCRLADRYSSLQSRERNAAGDGLNSIVQPAGRAPPSVAEGQRSIVVEQIQKAVGQLRECSVA